MTPIPFKRWDVKCAPAGSPRLRGMLESGWEPFAVTVSPDSEGFGMELVWCRQQVEVPIG